MENYERINLNLILYLFNVNVNGADIPQLAKIIKTVYPYGIDKYVGTVIHVFTHILCLLSFYRYLDKLRHIKTLSVSLP